MNQAISKILTERHTHMHTPSHIIITVKQAAKNSNITYSMTEYRDYRKIMVSSLVKLLLFPQ